MEPRDGGGRRLLGGLGDDSTSETRTDTVELLRRLVEFDTVNDPENDVRPSEDCFRFISEKLSGWGIENELIEREGYYTVTGSLGEGDSTTLLMAHCDTVPPGPNWQTHPFALTIEDRRGYGRGAADDKGNVVAVLKTLRKLAESGVEGVAFSFNGDEEVGGRNGAGYLAQRLEERGRLPSRVINCDGLGQRIINRRRNAFRPTIRFSARPRETTGAKREMKFFTEFVYRETRHSAYFLPGVDSHALLQCSTYLRENPKMQVESLVGDFVKDNVVPDSVTAQFVDKDVQGEEVEYDEALAEFLRLLYPLTRINVETEPSEYGVTITPNTYRVDEEGNHAFTVDVRAMTAEASPLREEIERVLGEADFEADLTVRPGGGYVSTHTDAELVQKAGEVASELGLTPRPIEREGAADSRYFSARGVPCIDFGPIGGNIHGPNEWVSLDSLEEVTEFYTRLTKRFHQ